MRTVDLNADLGEEIDGVRTDDEGLVAVVTSANVACGFHSGDAATMRHVSELCVARGVAIGAQVSYRDREGFGRRFIDVAPARLAADVREQLVALAEQAAAVRGRIDYVKPHGALYNALVRHERQAAAVVEAVAAHDGSLAVLGLPGSRWLALAQRAGLRPVPEAFADRAYRADGTLVPRSEQGAVVEDAEAVVARSVRLVTAREVIAVDGSVVPVDARSLCVHGDTPGAVRLATSVRTALERAGVVVTRFAPAG